MNALVQHVDAKQQLQAVTFIGLEVGKSLVCTGVIRVGFVDRHFRIHLCKPLRHMRDHFVHVLLVGAEHDVLSGLVRDMMSENLIQSICLFQGTAQGIQIFLIYVLNPSRTQIIHSCLIACQVFLVLIDGSHIVRSRQNTPDDCFAKGHVARNTAVKKLFGHVTVIIQISDVCRCQAQQSCVRA